VIHNIIFKFATADRHGLYSDDEHAAKVTSHELKGLTSYFNCNIEDLCFPMMVTLLIRLRKNNNKFYQILLFYFLMGSSHFISKVLVDYRGFRVSAVSMLPVRLKISLTNLLLFFSCLKT
jgi:hypothetical protein